MSENIPDEKILILNQSMSSNVKIMGGFQVILILNVGEYSRCTKNLNFKPIYAIKCQNYWMEPFDIKIFRYAICLFNSAICCIINHIVVKDTIYCQDPVIPHVVLCVHITKSQWKSLNIKNVVSDKLYEKRHNICSLNTRICEAQKFLTIDPLPN